MIQTKSEDAVSPVIGVMLMLVVTIIIAAVVAVFASGVGMDAEPAPTTVVEIVEVSDGYYGTSYDDWVDEKTVTLSCSHGEILNLEKISIEIHYNGELISNTDSLSGTLTPGSINKIPIVGHYKITENNVVDVVVYYGDYKIAEKKRMTVVSDYRYL